ncbi:MAG: ATP-binding cassette domain-containing protein [Thaumarchaeota archaeon]|nr:ATP-binding cassette domain-containing protein [Nitrososphaerota archaeon]
MVSAKELTKVYSNSLVAVDHITFEVGHGEICGFLGPNGAGKTTTIRMLTTLTKPSSGHATVGGFDVSRQPEKVREILGIVPQDLSVDDDLTGMQNLMLQSKLYHVPGTEAKNRAEELLALVDLTQFASKDVVTYSGGMRKRLEIACGLIGRPKVLFLDEPTLGLDVQSRLNIWDHLKALNNDFGLTLFVTTHYMEEADSLCDKIIIMDHGKIVASGSPEDLKSALAETMFELTVESDSGDTVALLKSHDSVLVVDRIDKTRYRAKISCSEEELQPILREMEGRHIKIASLYPRRPGLDEVFLHYTGNYLKEDLSAEGTIQKALKNVRRAKD